MRPLLSVLLLGVVGGLAGCARPDMRPNLQALRGFHAPSSRCEGVAGDRLLTSVGTLPGAGGGAGYEVVAAVKLGEVPADGRAGDFFDPSLTVFDEHCEPVWRQSFPGLGEVGFEVLSVPGGPLLHVVGRSVFYPVGRDVFDHEILDASSGSVAAVSPAGLRSDGARTAYVGPIDRHAELGLVVTTYTGSTAAHARLRASRSLVYRWRGYRRADRTTMHAFAGPEVLHAKRLAALRLGGSLLPRFPLYAFMLGS